MFREDEHTEFKKTTGEINEAMISISGIINTLIRCIQLTLFM